MLENSRLKNLNVLSPSSKTRRNTKSPNGSSTDKGILSTERTHSSSPMLSTTSFVKIWRGWRKSVLTEVCDILSYGLVGWELADDRTWGCVDSILRRLEEGVRLSVLVRRNKLVALLGVIKHVEYQCKLYNHWNSFATIWIRFRDFITLIQDSKSTIYNYSDYTP